MKSHPFASIHRCNPVYSRIMIIKPTWNVWLHAILLVFWVSLPSAVADERIDRAGRNDDLDQSLRGRGLKKSKKDKRGKNRKRNKRGGYSLYSTKHSKKNGRSSSSSSSSSSSADDRPYRPRRTILELTEGNMNLSILASLIADDGQKSIARALSGPGPFTLFAPLDSAFEELFRIRDPDSISAKELTDILSYHAVEGAFMRVHDRQLKVLSDDLLITLNGAPILVDIRPGVTVNEESRVVSSNFRARNGVIHVIDKVLIPPQSSIAELADNAGKFTTLLELLTAANLASIFADDDAGPFTVFAPTDDAFAKLGISTEELKKDIEALADILRYHVISSRIPFARLKKMSRATMLNKEVVTVDRRTLNDNANIVQNDLLATNGIVHVIDRVLIPRDNVEDEDDEDISVAPSMAPAIVPSMMPVLAPSMTPLIVPSMAPVIAPSTTPVIAPSTTPVIAPSTTPVIAPVVTPVLTPSLTPVIAPTVTPVVTPSLTPVIAPVVAPVLAPSLTPVTAPVVTPVLAPSLLPAIAPSETPVLAPSLTPVVPASALTVTADSETLDECEDLGDLTSCPIATDFELEGQFAFIAADLACPTDVVTQTNFAEASRQEGVCECEATKDDTQEMDCQCVLCPDGSALQFAYTCTLAIIADCTSINCNGECGDAVTI